MNNTPFDDAYKTIQEKFPSLLIPLVNEQFHTKYGFGEPIVNLGQETHKKNGKVIADSVFGIRKRAYHVECQSNPDGTISIRMLEYDFYIAMKNVRRDEHGIYHVKLPRSCILYLRHKENTPDEETIELESADGKKLIYRVPVIKAQKYSIDEIFEKDLLILLPFYILRYEDAINNEETGWALDAAVQEYKRIIEICENIEHRTDIDGKRIAAELEILMKRTNDYVFRNHNIARQRIGGVIMGGTAWKTLGEEIDELKEANATLEQKFQKLEITNQELEASSQEKDRINRILKLLLSGKSKEDISKMEHLSIEEINKLIN